MYNNDMIDLSKKRYKIKNDLELFIASEKIDIDILAAKLNYGKNTIYEMLKDKNVSKESIEKFYNHAYKSNYRFNQIKEEILKEENKLVLFHGSKYGLKSITINGARNNCDFGNGFYLGETFKQALSFVVGNKESSVYSFTFDIKDLNILTFKTDIEWVLAICYYRGKLEQYKNSSIIKNIINKINKADLIIAPIADNRMFNIMSLFVNGDINVNVTLHSLSASSLGKQYVIKKEQALDKLCFIEKYYLCEKERKECLEFLNERSFEIDTKIKMSKREFRNGLYIEEILKCEK